MKPDSSRHRESAVSLSIGLFQTFPDLVISLQTQSNLTCQKNPIKASSVQCPVPNLLFLYASSDKRGSRPTCWFEGAIAFFM